MTPRTKSFETTFKVGQRTVRMVIPVDARVATIEMQWHPDTPTRLSRAEMDEYRRGRDRLIAEIANSLGGTVAVVE